MSLDKGVLRRPIEIRRERINIVDGQLVKLDNPDSLFEEALNAALEEVPHGRHALIFVDDTDMPEGAREAIENSFSNRCLQMFRSLPFIDGNIHFFVKGVHSFPFTL